VSIVDRISHEVEYYRGVLKHAVLQGTYVINNPFWWTADDKFFNYSRGEQAGRRDPEDGVLPQKAIPPTSTSRRSRCATSSSRSTGTAARLRRPPGDPQAVLRRRLEARLQGHDRESCSAPTIARRRTA
jgi:hypothetical protein